MPLKKCRKRPNSGSGDGNLTLYTATLLPGPGPRRQFAAATAAADPGRTIIANMDIKIPSEPSSVRAASVQVGDLLSQLRVAGTVEARVVKLLNENQLLLNTRLGQILTSSTLDYRAGDRIKLRLDESSGQAVLKASSVEIKPLKVRAKREVQPIEAVKSL